MKKAFKYGLGIAASAALLYGVLKTSSEVVCERKDVNRDGLEDIILDKDHVSIQKKDGTFEDTEVKRFGQGVFFKAKEGYYDTYGHYFSLSPHED